MITKGLYRIKKSVTSCSVTVEHSLIVDDLLWRILVWQSRDATVFFWKTRSLLGKSFDGCVARWDAMTFVWSCWFLRHRCRLQNQFSSRCFDLIMTRKTKLCAFLLPVNASCCGLPSPLPGRQIALASILFTRNIVKKGFTLPSCQGRRFC